MGKILWKNEDFRVMEAQAAEKNMFLRLTQYLVWEYRNIEEKPQKGERV